MKNKNITTTAKRTINRIIWSKCLDGIENSSLSGILKFILLMNIAILLFLTLQNTMEMIDVFSRIFSSHDFFMVKAVGSFILIFNHETVIGLFPKKKKSRIKNDKPLNNTIEGVPVFEILDHLFNFGTFRRKEVEEKFGMPRGKFENLAKKLDELKILIRGENNSRILNPDFSRQELLNLFDGKTSAEQLKIKPRQDKPGVFAFNRPQGKQIKKKVLNGLSKTPILNLEPLFEYKRLTA